jgi:hypothetical protein
LLSVLDAVSHRRPANGSVVQGQRAAKEAGSRGDDIRGYGKRRAHPVPAAQSRGRGDRRLIAAAAESPESTRSLLLRADAGGDNFAGAQGCGSRTMLTGDWPTTRTVPVNPRR